MMTNDWTISVDYVIELGLPCCLVRDLLACDSCLGPAQLQDCCLAVADNRQLEQLIPYPALLREERRLRQC